MEHFKWLKISLNIVKRDMRRFTPNLTKRCRGHNTLNNNMLHSIVV